MENSSKAPDASEERDGLQYQKSFDFSNSAEDLSITLEGLKENETWYLIIKEKESAPSFVHPLTPDDGEAASRIPTLTWSKAQGADKYRVIVSESEDLSNPIVDTVVEDTRYAISEQLEENAKYYWTVIAQNQYGTTSVIHDVKYSFITNDPGVPGQFGPYLPSMYAPNESENLEFKWSTAYNADSYRLVVSKNADLSDPVINQGGITNVRDTAQFGPGTQAFYTPATSLEYDTTYYWMVYASNESGERPMNGPVHVFTTKAAGDAPLLLLWKDLTIKRKMWTPV